MTILVLPTDDPAILDARQQAAAILVDAQALIIDSDASQARGVAVLGAIARVRATAEARRVSLVKPYNEHVAAINRLFKDVLAPVEQANAHVRSLDLAYRQAQQRRATEAAALAERHRREAERLRLESEAKLAEAARAETAGSQTIAEHHLDRAVAIDAAAQAVQQQAVETQRSAVRPLKTVSTASGAATVTKRWAFRIMELSGVPREYLTLDEARVREAIRAGVREIPGLAIYQEESLSVRR